jgi:hypothetical protein
VSAAVRQSTLPVIETRAIDGSGTWTRARPAVNDAADGVKTLWVKPLRRFPVVG